MSKQHSTLLAKTVTTSNEFIVKSKIRITFPVSLIAKYKVEPDEF